MQGVLGAGLQGKGRSLTLPPAWIWEALAEHAPEAAAVACQAVDLSLAAGYFQVSCDDHGSIHMLSASCSNTAVTGGHQAQAGITCRLPA